MRFKVIDRLVAAVSGLIILIVGIALFVFGAGIFPFRLDLSFLDREFLLWQRAVMVAVALLLSFFGLKGIALLFRSSKEKGFIMQHTEYGDLSISLVAMENMVRKCVDAHEDLKVSHIRIHHSRDGIVISLRIALANGVNIPIAVSALQKQIKQYITSCSGVDVKEVRVMVETNNSMLPPAITPVASDAETLMADVDATVKAGSVMDSLHETAPQAIPVAAEQKEEPAHRPFHQRLFKREEKPQILPEAPAMETHSEVAADVAEEYPDAVSAEDVIVQADALHETSQVDEDDMSKEES